MPDRKEDAPPSIDARMRSAYESAESATARAFEQAVSTPSFGGILARSAENVAALSRIGAETADLVLRNLRLAGRSDITRLARALHRNEAKLERVLQEVESLRDELAARDATAAAENGNGRAATARPAAAESSRRSPGERRATGGARTSGGRSSGNGRSGSRSGSSAT